MLSAIPNTAEIPAHAAGRQGIEHTMTDSTVCGDKTHLESMDARTTTAHMNRIVRTY